MNGHKNNEKVTCVAIRNETEHRETDRLIAAPRQPSAAALKEEAVLATTASDGGVLNFSSNILLVYRLAEMRASASINLWLALLCLAYCGVNVALLYVNYVNSLSDGAQAGVEDEEKPVSELVFHLVEFWATFCFSVVECVSLVNTPKSLFRIYDNPLVLKLVLFFNIVATLVPAILVTLNREYFEILSHEVEYLNELTMSFVDLVLLWSLCRFDEGIVKGSSSGLVFTIAAAVVACVQLGVYNLMGRNGPDMVGEGPAHYFEFAFEILSSLIGFWFCMDNKFVADKEVGLILYDTHQDCGICNAKSVEFRNTYYQSYQTVASDPCLSSMQATGGRTNTPYGIV